MAQENPGFGDTDQGLECLTTNWERSVIFGRISGRKASVKIWAVSSPNRASSKFDFHANMIANKTL